jgi:hypothetical protein
MTATSAAAVRSGAARLPPRAARRTTRSMRRVVLALLMLLAPPALADEGMWTVNNFPRALVKERLGVDIDDAWLAHQRLSAVRFNSGGSGSFVSDAGLVLTNHHVGADCIAKLGKTGADLYRDGFYARAAADEIKCPDLELNVLQGIEDVTAKIRAVERADASEAERARARREQIASLEKACADQHQQRCDVVTLYRGGRYDLYRYKKYTDVRLVFAPEKAIAFFGGDPDNFTYPRYDLDVAVFRAYEGGQAAHPEAWLRFAVEPARENDPTFTVGHPGNSERLSTSAMLQTYRDLIYPRMLADLDRLHALLTAFGAAGGEAERAARKPLYSISNSRKAYGGFFDGLKDPQLLKDKGAAEARMRTGAGKPALAAEVSAAYDAIAKAEQARRELYPRWQALEGRTEPMARAFNEITPLGARLYGIARALVRSVDEQARPSAERLKDFGDAARPSLELALFSPAPIDRALDQALLQSGLERLAATLGPADPALRAALGGKTPAERAAAVMRGTKLADVAVRRRLSASRAAQDAAKDPMIELVRALDPAARAVRKRYADEVEGPEESALGTLARAQLELSGSALAPDATFTLRVSFGRVAGYKEGERNVPPITVLAGLFARSRKADNQPPWEIPKRWFDRKAQLKPTTPFNLVTTNDIIGGNSGSPLVNARGELIGVIFDENIHGLAHAFGYRPDAGRAVSVHASGLIEALRKVYDAGALADELTGMASKH